MNIYVWSNFTKRKNSTLQPTSGTLKQVVLKEDTSISNPTFIINEPLPSYTYVSAFGNYYFVSDITNLSANQSAISCSIDVLATYRSSILNYTAFVERSASNYDLYVNDPLLSSRQIITSETVTNTPRPSFFGTGCYISEVMTKDSGIVLYVTPDLSVFRQILDPNCYDAQDIVDWIDKKIAQAFDLDVYVGSIKWVPFTASEIGSSSSTFFVGPVDVGVPSGYVVRKANQNFIKRHTVEITLPSTGLFNDFRDCNPNFTQYNVSLAGIGNVELDPSVIGSCIHNSRSLYCDIRVDLVSGDIVYQFHIGSVNSQFARFKGNISVNVPIGKSVSDMTNSISMVAGGIGGGAVAGGVVGAVVGGVAGLIGAIHNELTPQTSIVGGSGNKADLESTRGYILLSRRTYGSCEYASTVAGRPLMKNVQLSTLSGFCQCGNASVPVNARDEERDMINSYLNSGVYIE